MFNKYRQQRYINKLVSRRDMEFKIRRLELELETSLYASKQLSRKLIACINDRDRNYTKVMEQSLEIQMLTNEIDGINTILNDLREEITVVQKQKSTSDEENV